MSGHELLSVGGPPPRLVERDLRVDLRGLGCKQGRIGFEHCLLPLLVDGRQQADGSAGAVPSRPRIDQVRLGLYLRQLRRRAVGSTRGDRAGNSRGSIGDALEGPRGRFETRAFFLVGCRIQIAIFPEGRLYQVVLKDPFLYGK